MKLLQYGLENITKNTRVHFCGSSESFSVEMYDEIDETISITSKNGSTVLAHFEDCTVSTKEEENTIDDLIRALRVRKFNRKFKHKRIHR